MSTQRTLMPVDKVIDHETRERWLAARMGGIGASESAALFGASPYHSRLSLWLEKTGRVPPWEPSPEMKEQLEWGQVFEAPIAEVYARRSRRKIWGFSSYCIAQHPAIACMFATPDRFIIEAPDRREMGLAEEGALQIKNTANTFNADGWGDGVPLHVQIQEQHELAVTAREYATVAALANGNKLMHWDIARNDEFIAELEIQCEQFWEDVLAQREPAADGHRKTIEALKRLHPRDNGKTIRLSEEAGIHWQSLRDAKAAIKEAEKKVDAADARLRQLIGPHTYALLPDGRKLSFKTTDNAGGTHVTPPYSYRTLRETKQPIPAPGEAPAAEKGTHAA